MKYSYTGRSRYKEHFRLFKHNLIVLQVEIREEGSVPKTQTEANTDYLPVVRTYWRDANLDDVVEMEEWN